MKVGGLDGAVSDGRQLRISDYKQRKLLKLASKKDRKG